LHRHPNFKAWAALGAVCLFWGTTYLGIRMSLESFPPLTLVAIRFSVSGLILLAAARLRGAEIPRGRDLRIAAFTGTLALGGGTGGLVIAEQWVPSGLAALLITTSPFWMVGIEAAMPGGERLHRPVVLGMLVGAAGVVLLGLPGAAVGSMGAMAIYGLIIIQVGNALWAYASILQRRQPVRAHPIVTGAVQQLAAGLSFVVPAIIFEGAGLVAGTSLHPSVRGIGALIWLVIFGSIVGYSAYMYALLHLPVAIVSTYAYVNPMVAVTLGWLVYRERFGWLEAAAMVIIFAGVMVVKRHSPEKR
jgi:drug/metabolite transporter (DMT)-like permease